MRAKNLTTSLPQLTGEHKVNQRIYVITTVFNAKEYIEKCLSSTCNQNYSNFHLYVVDDGSTDGTSEIVRRYAELNPKTVTARVNLTNTGCALENIVIATSDSGDDPNDIICLVDGDDWLAHENVLSYINGVYSDAKVWMTYGQYEPASKSYKNMCQPLLSARTYRNSGQWYTSHLHTHKRHLWDRIRDEDLRDIDGQHFKTAYDNAIMFPMIEMSGLNRIKFIPDVLYVYNDLNPANEMKIKKQEQIDTAKRIRSKTSYSEI